MWVPFRRPHRFHRLPLRFHSNVGVTLQHGATEVSGERHHDTLSDAPLCHLRKSRVPQIVEPALHAGIPQSRVPRLLDAERRSRWSFGADCPNGNR